METVPYYDLKGLWPVRYQPVTPALASMQWPSSANSNGINSYANATPQQQRTEHEEKLIGLVLCQLIQVENLHDVGATVPEKIGVQWPCGIAFKGLADILWVAEPPFDRGVIRADGYNIHLIKKGQAIRPDAWLGLMPLGMGRIHFPVWAWLVPQLPPTRPYQQDIALLDLDLLRFRGILEIFERDSI